MTDDDYLEFTSNRTNLQKLSTKPEEKFSAMRACRYFASLSDGILHDISGGMYLARYARGEVLFWQGEPCAGLHIIRQGSVKLFKVSQQGRELIVKIFEDGESFNEVPVFDFGSNPVNAAALEDSEIWVVEAAGIRGAIEKHPEMCKAVIANLSQNLRMLVKVVEELSFFQVTNRLARLISQLPAEQLVGQGSAHLTQDQIAARLGTVREVVARSLRELERSGAIRVDRRQIQVMDETLLKQWAQGPSN